MGGGEPLSPGDQAAYAKSRLHLFVAAHGAVAFFDPPANGAFTIVVGAVYDLISVFVLPSAIESQARPEVPAIQAEQPQPELQPCLWILARIQRGRAHLQV